MSNKTLVIKWSKREGGFVARHPDSDYSDLGHMLIASLSRGFEAIYQAKLVPMLDELGYDPKSLKITINRKVDE